jgi:hypothetical protein
MIMARMKAMRRAQRDQLIHAYQIGTFVGFAKLPPLRDILRRLDEDTPTQDQGRPAMSEAEIMHTMSLWSAAAQGRGLSH